MTETMTSQKTSQKLTVLILEDTLADADLIADALRGANFDFTVIQVDQEQEFHRLLHQLSPDLIFADHSLVNAHGQSALAASQHLHPAVPFIFISDTPGEEMAVEAVRRGATDYVLKQGLTRLGTVVRRALREKKEIQDVAATTDTDRQTFPGFTERKGDSKRLCELSRLLRAVREINKLIVRERDPETLLADACNILIRTRGYLHVGIGLVASRFRRVPPVTRSLRKAEFLDGFSITWSGEATDHLPACATIHSGRSWVCQDIATDPRFAPWRDSALACNCASLAAIPMIHWGQVIGALTVCSDRSETFHREEIRLLEELAEDLAFALECIRRDQTYRSAEAHLRLLNSALKSVANSIVITDRAGLVLWTNPAFTALTGYPLEEVRGKTTNILKSGVHDDAFYRQLWETILAGRAWRSEMVNRRKDGSLYTEECTITPVRNEEGEVAHFIAVKQDITERKLAEEALRWRTAFFEALVDSSLDGILVVDSQGKKLLQNRRMNELWKIPPHIADDPDDSKQVEFVATRTKNPRQFVEKIAYLYAQTNEVSRDEIELIDGRVLDRYTSPVRDTNGTYYGRIWMFRDISEQRKLEAQFRQAQKMEAVGQLAGGVAHDFNNILTAVLMHLGILRTTLKEPGTVEALKELESQARRAADLTRQLLMFSRKSAIEVKPTDLNHVVEEMLKMLGRLLGEQVQVEFQGAQALPLIEADPGMMQQVIMNLSVNGRDAMPHGGRLTICTRRTEFDKRSAAAFPDGRAGSFVQLSVSDTGSGMDEITRKRIFEPFFTTKELGKGTGLGLATVYGIVQQHRGWIDVDSEPGKGSNFHVYLPISERAGSGNPVETTLTTRGGKETILLVEDEPMVRRATARTLQMLGYRVIEATDGKMAIELWSQHAKTIDLLLTDMVMPHGISGMDLAAKLQKERSTLKVIIISGYSREISARGIPSTPGILYLPKPFEMLHLASTLRTCLDQK